MNLGDSNQQSSGVSVAAGVALLLGGAMAGVLFFLVAPYSRVPHPDDYRMYFLIFGSIGTLTGFLTWYLARLVARQHISLGQIVGIVAIPYAFSLFIAFGRNLLIVIVATVVFGFPILYAYMVGRAETVKPKR